MKKYEWTLKVSLFFFTANMLIWYKYYDHYSFIPCFILGFFVTLGIDSFIEKLIRSANIDQ